MKNKSLGPYFDQIAKQDDDWIPAFAGMTHHVIDGIVMIWPPSVTPALIYLPLYLFFR